MAGPLPMRFVRSFTSADDLPHVHAEVALVGRSNVGKSSLINALAQRKSLARTSKSPGATRLLNAFEVGGSDSGRWLMDLPGYGFAKVSKTEQQRWAEMLNTYIEERENLVSVLLLIDSEIGPTALDLQTCQWLEHLNREICFVATKADKVRPAKSKKRRVDLAQKLGVDKSEITWVSANKGTGIAELRRRISGLLEIRG
ncbi:MAG: YihA family ribosome biogenesis GTP-binding protein [Acidimicrobiaceae bacterium]|nr:ribosome biogenesis GTP-binding protein YihA/YsxC [Acidimicrobiaceae bacterium]MXW62082.1 YihA family ribosome biogenesis GTP-binding protein [Acidimicrobiaceae bacterium]MXW77027.1 YihA family ribosome biogenesis GTP-binding protein [Acidimicrobiaceae bacterium]MYA74862.1 YihA family ribosome biogenesis GTP-binding protein [Acidimicrobiaceae bacterium]MYC43659.1 YihA family ribosome biogenesis GTP-binding protein [Acidimicrobiaceae bacterium]